MVPGSPDIEMLSRTRNVAGLVAALEYDGDPAIPPRAAQALLGMGVKTALQGLKEHIPPVLAEALLPLPAETLMDGLREVDTPRRLKVVHALAKTGDERAAACLNRCLQDDAPAVREQAVVFLRSLNNAKSPQALAKALDDPHLKDRALKTLRAIAGKEDVQRFAEQLRQTEDRQGRIAAVRALAAIGSDDAAELLVEALNTSDADLRLIIIRWLGHMQHAHIVPVLLELLHLSILAKDAAVMSTTVLALSRCGDRRALDSILGLRGYPDILVHLAVEHAIRQLNDPEEWR